MRCKILRYISLLVFASSPCITDESAAAEPSKDIHSDPLPEGAIARLGSARLTGSIFAFSPDGKKVVRERVGGDLQLFEVPSGKFLARIRGSDVPNRNWIIGYTLSFSPDSKHIAAVLWEGRTGIWDTEKGKLVRWLESGKFYSVAKCDFSPDGKMLAVGGSVNESDTDNISTCVYDVESGKSILRVMGTNSLFGDDGKSLFVWNCYTDQMNKIGKIRRVSISDPEDWTEFGLTTQVSSYAGLRTDFARVLFELRGNGDVCILDLKDGLPNHTLKGATRTKEHRVNLAYARGRRELYVMQDEPPMAWCWDIDTGKELWKRKLPSPASNGDLSLDGKTLVLPGQEGEVLVVDATNGKDIAAISAKSVGHGRNARVSPDGKIVATFSPAQGRGENTVIFWDAATGKRLTVTTGHTTPILSAHFSVDNRRISTSSDDGTLRSWDAKTGRELFKESMVAMLHPRAAPDGKTIFGSDKTSGTIRTVDVSTGRNTAAFEEFKRPLMGLAVTADGLKLIAAGRNDDEDGTIRILDAKSGKRLGEFETKRYAVEQMAISLDGSIIATSCAGRTVAIWNDRGKLLSKHDGSGQRGPSSTKNPPHYLIGSVAVSPDGKRVAFSDQEEGIGVIDTAAGKLLGHIKLKNLSFDTNSNRNEVSDVLAFSPDGKTLAWSGLETTSKFFICDVEKRTQVQEFDADLRPIKGLAFSPDGSKLLSAGPDGSALIWDLAVSTTSKSK